jgi:integrase
MNREKVRVLIEAARGNRLELVVLFAAVTGLRRGEVLALRWKCVDIAGGNLYVAEALEHTRNHGVRFKLPKSKRSRRAIPLSVEIVEALRSHHLAREEVRRAAGRVYADHDLVFPNPDGTPWPPDSLSVQFAKLARSVGCQGFRFQDLRHGFETMLLSGVSNLREVAALMGNDPKVMLSSYAHVMEGHGRAAVNSLARSLLGGGQVAEVP